MRCYEQRIRMKYGEHASRCSAKNINQKKCNEQYIKMRSKGPCTKMKRDEQIDAPNDTELVRFQRRR